MDFYFKDILCKRCFSIYWLNSTNTHVSLCLRSGLELMIFSRSGCQCLRCCHKPSSLFHHSDLTLLLLNTTCPVLAKSVDADQKPTDLDLHCLSLNMWISIENPDQVIWLAGNKKWAWHLNLFSMKMVYLIYVLLFVFLWYFTNWDMEPLCDPNILYFFS